MKISTTRILLGLLSTIIGLFFIVAAWEAFEEYNRVKSYDGYAVGHVTQKHFQRASDGNTTYSLDYWFALPDGDKVSSTNSILKQNWDSLKIDDTFEIRYDRSSPSRNIPMYGGSVSILYAIFIFLLGAVIFFFGMMRLIAGFKNHDGKSA